MRPIAQTFSALFSKLDFLKVGCRSVKLQEYVNIQFPNVKWYIKGLFLHVLSGLHTLAHNIPNRANQA